MNRIELITSVERRRRWSRVEKERWVSALMEPGAVAAEVARTAGVDTSLLYRWRQQLTSSRNIPSFVPVAIAPSAPEPVAEAMMPAITIEFSGGVRVKIEGAPDTGTLASVIVECRAWPMIAFSSGVRVWLATGHTDMRRGFPSLALLVQEALKRDPYAGDFYVFRGRRGDLIKVIWHDGQGAFCSRSGWSAVAFCGPRLPMAW